jgi:hypothetical protein
MVETQFRRNSHLALKRRIVDFHYLSYNSSQGYLRNIRHPRHIVGIAFTTPFKVDDLQVNAM